MRDSEATPGSDVVLGEDWVAPTSVESELRDKRARRGLLTINRSPLARKIIIFNILGLIVLVAGVLYLNPFRDSLVNQRERGLVTEARLVADVFEATLLNSVPGAGDTGATAGTVTGPTPEYTRRTLAGLALPQDVEVFVFDRSEALVGTTQGMTRNVIAPAERKSSGGSTVISDFFNRIWDSVTGESATSRQTDGFTTDITDEHARTLLPDALSGNTKALITQDTVSGTVFTVATPIRHEGATVGAVAITSVAGELDQLVRSEREQVLQMFIIAILVSIGLSLVLASTIANPLADLAAAAELGRDKNSKKVNPGRVRIPDLTGRPDEIGRLSAALRGMVAALYDRIDSNEQFAADVAHEIKNPLASLRSAIGTMRVAKKEEQREKLLDVIDHDVRRLDRLVSDISNASRLDSELVKEEEEPFDLLKMLRSLSDYLGNEAGDKGVEFITDLPPDPIVINGLEARLAQVFVNLITNAISFCEDGDAIRVWARHRENRVLVVVEDTGPGIPEQALTKIFNRFYSERPEGQFGNNSGLGLAISKQIVEAHGGVIWAENIRPTDADITSDPLGARFVVGLPL